MLVRCGALFLIFSAAFGQRDLVLPAVASIMAENAKIIFSTVIAD